LPKETLLIYDRIDDDSYMLEKTREHNEPEWVEPIRVSIKTYYLRVTTHIIGKAP
jgi:hypothetical protein